MPVRFTGQVAETDTKGRRRAGSTDDTEKAQSGPQWFGSPVVRYNGFVLPQSVTLSDLFEANVFR